MEGDNKEITVKVRHNPFVVKIPVEGDFKKLRELATAKIGYRVTHPNVRTDIGRGHKLYSSLKEKNHIHYERRVRTITCSS